MVFKGLKLILPALIILGATPVSAQDITSNLIGHWKFDETSGTTAGDSAGSNDGTMVGGLDASNDSSVGKNGQAITFDGIDDYIDFGSSATLKPALPITMSAWVYLPTGSSGTVFHNDFIENKYSGARIAAFIGGNAQAQFGDGGNIDATTRRTKKGTTILLADTWYHIAVVIRGATDMDVYVNGVDDGGTYEGTGGTSMVYLAGIAQAGRFDNTAPTTPLVYKKDTIDDLRIYGRALSAADVAELYNTTLSITCDANYEAVMLYNRDEGVLQYCNGIEWSNMGPKDTAAVPGGTCSSPDGVEGEVGYNYTQSVMQYCNGANWVNLGPALHGSSHAFNIPTTNLAGHWAFEDTVGGSATDSSSNTLTGTINGSDAATLTSTGTYGLAFNLDGINDNITTATGPELGGGDVATLSTWVKNNAATIGAQQGLLLKGGPTFEILIDATGAIVSNIDNGAWHTAATSPTYSDWNSWHHITATYDGANVRIYRDGIEVVASGAESGNLNAGTDGLTIGLDSAGTGYWAGQLDDARIYDRALNATEVEQLFLGTGGAPATSTDLKTCAAPAGVEGEMSYNDDFNIMQYCNGTAWIGVR